MNDSRRMVPGGQERPMADEKITVRMESGKTLEVVVVSKQAEAITVVLGEGLHNVKCKLVPTNSGLAYAGSVMGREIVYECSVKQVKEALSRAVQPTVRFRPRS
jgi:hypothetical protein